MVPEEVKAASSAAFYRFLCFDVMIGCRGHFNLEYLSESFCPLKALSVIFCPLASAISDRVVICRCIQTAFISKSCSWLYISNLCTTSIMWQLCWRLFHTSLAEATFKVILLLARNSQMHVNQHFAMYGTHSLGCSRRWKPLPDSIWSDRRAIRIRLPTESLQNRWSVKCWIPRTPCSTLISSSAMPQRSLGPKATLQGNALLTPSFWSIACIACHWIQFKVFTSIIVTGS
jgi:hypothetical protein